MKKQDLESVSAYPLEWPQSRPRTKNPKRSNFHKKKYDGYGTRSITVAEARDFLLNEIRLNKGTLPIISTNIRTRNDGLPYSNAAEPDDSGVAAYFLRNGKTKVIAMDTFDRVADNLYAAGKVIEALRLIDRYGSTTSNAAWTGFNLLPESGSGIKWWEVLRVDRDASFEDIKRSHRKLVKQYHPDKNNGDSSEFRLIQRAFTQAEAVKK